MSLGKFPGFLLDDEATGVATDCRYEGKRGAEAGLVRAILKLWCLYGSIICKIVEVDGKGKRIETLLGYLLQLSHSA